MKIAALASLALLSANAQAQLTSYTTEICKDAAQHRSKLEASAKPDYLEKLRLEYKDRQCESLTKADEKDNRQRAEFARLAALPHARIGMSSEQVRNETSWGSPEKVNTTTTRNATFEQWVYNGGYLYFTNGKLTAVQN